MVDNYGDIIGAAAIGVADYRILAEQRVHLDAWLEEGCADDLGYMHNHRREDPAIVMEQCRGLIVCLFSPQRWSYHSYIRRRLRKLLEELQRVDSGIVGRGVVDSAPIMERAWGVEARLGWIGKNSMLLHPELGSNFNVGIVLINRNREELAEIGVLGRLEVLSGYDLGDGCVRRGCSECLVACPSGAIKDNRTIDCRICLSHRSQRAGLKGGCTLCQQVCPYNK